MSKNASLTFVKMTMSDPLALGQLRAGRAAYGRVSFRAGGAPDRRAGVVGAGVPGPLHESD